MNDVDPEGLLRLGAPVDEYDSEVGRRQRCSHASTMRPPRPRGRGDRRDARGLTAVASAGPQRYVLIMVAKPSARVEELLAAAAELAPEERQAFVEGLAVMREHTTAADARHAELLRRVERVRRGEATTLSLDEAEQSLRAELDF
jgi:hypothetical protein